jgi:hypothetical protein
MSRNATNIQLGFLFEEPDEAAPEPPGAVAVPGKPKRVRRGNTAELERAVPTVTDAGDPHMEGAGEEEAAEEPDGAPTTYSQPRNLPLECIQCGRTFGRADPRFVYEPHPGRSYVIEVVREDGTREQPRYVATCVVSPSPDEPTCREVFQARLEELEVAGPARKPDRKGSVRR